MEYRQLTGTEKRDLRYRHKSERDGRIRDRIKAVLMYDNGYSMPEIAEVLLLSHEGIRKHLEDYHREEKLAPENGSSCSKLSIQQEKELIEHGI